MAAEAVRDRMLAFAAEHAGVPLDKIPAFADITRVEVLFADTF